MNFQGLHRTIQFSISSLALGKRQKHNISHFFDFANRFLKFFRFFSKPNFFKNLRSAKFCVLYQPRCIVVFDAQQKHNISHFFNFASELLKFFRFFIFNRSVSKSITSRGISALRYALIRRNGNIIYHRFKTLQAEFSFFQQKNRLSAQKTRKNRIF